MCAMYLRIPIVNALGSSRCFSASMRPRAARFAEQWLYENVSDAKGGPVSASDLADQLVVAGAYADIPAEEFEDDGNGVFEMVFAELERKSAK
jgi:hypothetical protein